MAENDFNNEFIATRKTFAELSKDQYKTLLSQAAAVDLPPPPPLPTLFPPGTIISGAPLNQAPPLPGAFPGVSLPVGSLPTALPAAPLFPAPIGFPYPGLPLPGTIISGSAAPAVK